MSMDKRIRQFKKILTLPLAAFAATLSAVTLENSKVRVEIGDRGELKSLVCKETGHDCRRQARGHEEKEVPVFAIICAESARWSKNL
jgi:hypothetical protein